MTKNTRRFLVKLKDALQLRWNKASQEDQYPLDAILETIEKQLSGKKPPGF
jgi:hypothetical protein